jgi:hypothetical protein
VSGCFASPGGASVPRFSGTLGVMRSPFSDRVTFGSWLDSLSPRDQIVVCRVLTRYPRAELAAHADLIIYRHTRDSSRAGAASALGLTDREVVRAVTNHRKRHPELTGPTEPAGDQ